MFHRNDLHDLKGSPTWITDIHNMLAEFISDDTTSNFT